MPYSHGRLPAFFALQFLIFLAGCGAKPPECDSFETRKAVLDAITNNQNDPLANYAAKKSYEKPGPDTQGQAPGNPNNPKGTKPLYKLGDKVVTTKASADKRTLECSGAISATVGDTRASKEVNFTVQKEKERKRSVPLKPFQF